MGCLGRRWICCGAKPTARPWKWLRLWASIKPGRRVCSFAFAGRKPERVASGGYPGYQAPRGHMAQNYAFGVLFVILSGIMAIAMIVKKHPEGAERAISCAVALLADWRTWAVVTAGAALAAVVCVLLPARR